MEKKIKTQELPIAITNNVFNTKVFDETTILAINDVSKALLNLTELFKSGNVQVTGIQISQKDKTTLEV